MKSAAVVGIAALLALAGCEQAFQSGSARALEKADRKAGEGDYRAAVDLYEAALDGTARTAEVHWKLAVLCETKLKDPLAALHHYRRYLEVAPEGDHAKDAKESVREGESRAVATLSRGELISREDSVRLKNENLSLQKQIAELRATMRERSMPPKTNAAEERARRNPPPGSRTYTVLPGDTLASIARKFYKSTARYKDILDANYNELKGKPDLKPGQVLIIP